MNPLARTLSAFRSDKGLKGQLLRGGVGSLAVKLGSTLLNVILAVVLARTLGAEGFGIYSFVFALITILAIPAQMGLPNLVVRETAKAQAHEDWSLIKGLWRWSTLMALAMSVALMVLGGVAAWLFATRLPDGGLVVFYWGLILIPLVALGNLRGAALRGLRHVVQGQLPEFILRPAFLILLVLGAHFGLSTHALSASDAMMLHALASLIAFVIGAWLLLRARPAALLSEPGSKSHPRAWLASALPLALFTGVQVVNMNVGLVTTGMLSSNEEVGFLRIALQGATLVSLGLAAANMVASPYIAQMIESRDLERLQSFLTYTARIVTIISIPIIVAYVFLGKELISIVFGRTFSPAYVPLIILVFGQLWNSIMSSNDVLLNMAGRERIAVRGVIAGTLVNCFFCVAFIPNFGASGAAAAFSASLFVWNTYLWLKARQLLNLDTSAIAWPPLRKRSALKES